MIDRQSFSSIRRIGLQLRLWFKISYMRLCALSPIDADAYVQINGNFVKSLNVSPQHLAQISTKQMNGFAFRYEIVKMSKRKFDMFPSVCHDLAFFSYVCVFFFCRFEQFFRAVCISCGIFHFQRNIVCCWCRRVRMNRFILACVNGVAKHLTYLTTFINQFPTS